ncbi:MAG: hypothetical protein RIT45_1037 [Pseudomonadota bacterium]
MRLTSLAAGLCWVTVCLSGAAHAAAPTYDLPALLDFAAAQSPELRAARARWEVRRATAHVAERWPEPSVSGGVFLRPVHTRVGPQRARLDVAVPLPWPGKIAARTEAMAAMRDVAEREIDARLAALRARLRAPWARRRALLQIATLHDAQRGLLLQLERTVLARLEVGRASYADAQRLRLWIAQLASDAESARDEARALEDTLRAVAGLPAGATLADAEPAGPADAALPGPIPTLHALRDTLASEPGVRVAEARIAAADAGRRVAALRGRPDFGVGLSWIAVGEAVMPGVADSGDDALMLTARVTVPVWRESYDHEARAADAEVRAAAAERDAAMRRAEARATQWLFELRDAERRRRLLDEELLPRARAALGTVTAAYGAGKADFQSVVELQRQLLGYGVERARAGLRAAVAIAELEALLAAPLWGTR